LKQGGSDKAQAFPQGLLESVCLLEQSDQQVTDEGSKYLNPNCVFGSSQELLDPEVLLDPFEEELDAPALLVTLSNLERAASNVVGGEDDWRSFFGARYGNAA
jgi:hypothetical protein